MRCVRLVPALVVMVALVASCGDEVKEEPSQQPKAAPAERPTQVPGASGEVTTSYPVTVLDDGDGAEACLGGVMDSFPPQCGGPSLVGWEWAEHAGDFESASGVRWGDFVVTGSFDGASLTPSKVVPADEFEEPDYPAEPERGTPCAAPEGGWQVVDQASTNQDTMDRTFRTAETLDGYADSWMDQSINPVWNGGDVAEEDIDKVNDPALVVINVRVTEDQEGAERALREVWGGSLCVSTAQHTEQQLRRIQDELNELPGMLSSAPGDDRVELMVTYDDGSYQDWADATYGEGLVSVFSVLQPAN